MPNSAFYRIVNNENVEQLRNADNNNIKNRTATNTEIRNKNITLSRHYYQEEMYGSDENSLEDDKSKESDKPRNKLASDSNKLISEGYLIKGKPNQK